MKKKVMGYDKGGKMPLPKRKPRHANPNHPMNAERTTGHPDGVTRKTRGGKVKKYNKGGKMTDAMKAKALKEYGKSGIKTGKNPGKSIEDLILEVGMEQGVFSKKKGGSVKKYDKGGSVTKDQKLSALKKAMKGMGKGGSGAGDSKMGKMIKEIGFPMSNKKSGGVVKKKAGGSMKPVPAGNRGLAKLPKPVRNKMGYAKKGGSVKAAKHGGKMCRGGGAATRGKSYGKAG